MDLLPKTHTQFSEKNYWEKFFKKLGTKAFEWYGEYSVLCGLLLKYVKPPEKILMVGCGNSSLSADMYDFGSYRGITNIDISDVVIGQMTMKNKDKRPDMPFLKMDMLQMDFGSETFSAVLDKGTLDALMTDSEPKTLEKVNKMFDEIARVLKTGGRYIAVSLAQDHILRHITQQFVERGCWMVRVCRVEDDENAEARTDFYMPVFMFVFTKMKMKMPKPMLEFSVFDGQKPTRYDSVEELFEAVKQLQQYALVRQQLKKKSSNSPHDEPLSVELFSAASEKHPRYVLTVVDSAGQWPDGTKTFAVFIVPQGREMHWLFSSPDGMRELSKSAGFARIVVVTLSREHEYTDLSTVKAELSKKVMELAPSNTLEESKIPFLTESSGDLGHRDVVYKGFSKLSGELVVEDMEHKGKTYRRLIFMNSPLILQSEALLLKAPPKGKKGKKKRGGGAGAEGGGREMVGKRVIDASHLCSNYCKVLVEGLSFMEDKSDTGLDILMLGLGGGGLPLYILKHYPKVSLEVVEIDSVVADVARQWFQLPEDDRLKITIADALDVVFEHSSNGSQHDVVVLDVAGSEDKPDTINCPPAVFLQPAFLGQVHSILKPTGMLIVNVVCRSQKMKEDFVIKNLREAFTTVYKNEVREHVNEIYYAFPQTREKPRKGKKKRSKAGDLTEILNLFEGLTLM